MEDSDKSRIEVFKKIQAAIGNDGTSFEEIENLTKELRELGNEQDAALCDQIVHIAKIRLGECQPILSDLEKEKKERPYAYVYALHNLGNQSDALRNIDSLAIDKNEYYAALLNAQILYKLEQKDKAYEVYDTTVTQIKHENLEHDMNEITTNMLASLTNSDKVDQSQIKALEDKIIGDHNSDILFNISASYSTLQNQEKTAAKKLKESYEKAQEDGESDNSKFSVLSSFIAARLVSKASNTSEYKLSDLKLDELEPKKFDNAENEAAYMNNIEIIKSCFKGSNNSTSDLISKLTNALNSQKINQHQKEVFFLNLISLNLDNNKVGNAKKLIADIDKMELKFSDTFRSNLEVASFLLEKKFSDALAKIGTPNNTYQALCKAQIETASGKAKDAVNNLIKYYQDNNVTNSRLLSFLLKACIDCKLTEEKKMIVEIAVKNSETLPKDLLALIGHILIEDQNYHQAHQVFDKIQENSDDMKVKAGYLSTLAETDINKATEYLESLSSNLPDMDTDQDLHELLEEPLVNKAKERKRDIKQEDKIEETKAGGKIFIPKVKPKRKIKYPKSYDPENPGLMPDPERWIPKWQRSKGKKKLRMKGPQGDVKNIGKHNKKEFSTANIEAATGANVGKKKK